MDLPLLLFAPSVHIVAYTKSQLFYCQSVIKLQSGRNTYAMLANHFANHYMRMSIASDLSIYVHTYIHIRMHGAGGPLTTLVCSIAKSYVRT